MGPAVMILGIVLMIVIHEAGHFIAAKYFGIKATEAFFGFGPRLWSTTRGETEYGVKAIPLGGYVRIIGMNPFEEVAPEDEGRTYRERPFWQKSIVVLAGIFSHFVVAFILFYGLAVGYGTPEPETTVQVVSDALVVPSDGEDAVPFVREPDDRILSVDGVAFAEIDPLARNDGSTVEVVLDRAGSEVVVTTTDTVVPTPAWLDGLEAGDRLVALDGVTIATWDEFVALTRDRPGDAVVISVDRDGSAVDIATVLASRPFDGTEVGFLGVAPDLVTVRSGPIEGVIVAGGDLAEAGKASVAGLGGLVTNFGTILGATINPDSEVLNEVRPVSPIGLTRVASTAQIAIALLAWVNVFVGVLNVVPLYPLDGGHFAVAAYEKLRGRPADIRKMVPVAAAVFAFIVLLGILGIYFDIVSPLVVPG